MASPPPFRYDPVRDRYRDARGRYLSRVDVRRALDTAFEGSQDVAGALAVSLREGRIGLREWQTGMIGVIKRTHLQAAAAAKGGWSQLSPADFGRVGAAIKEQYRYLRAFAAQMEAGSPADGRFEVRSRMYGHAARRHFHAVQREQMRVRGFDEERNVRTARESCAGASAGRIGCVDASRRGWVPIGDLPAVGARICLTQCLCFIEYRSSATGAVER